MGFNSAFKGLNEGSQQMVHETFVKRGLRLNQRPWNRAIWQTIKKLSSWRKTKEPKGIICEKISDS
jgi:hypothetical protein